ncbi:SCO family protein [Thioalkalivibrio denitrificans]|uniref:SCO family protein n=1 Tax=Thioalkalivibrio denitrificans TaxID=108003 RepID=A0A1V3NPT7_9GAMM|nr:SCO family protein [Thioalkalivibrio denitrificans]OOG27117.1 SCO family protein [Thioalkalivibrio denitrificans]
MAGALHTRTVQLLLIVLAGAVAMAVGIGFGMSQRDAGPGQPLSLEGGTWLSEPRNLPEFELVDMHGEPFTKASLEGGWTFMFFGYTYCPDICPLTMALLGSAVEEVRRLDPRAEDPNVVLVSVDPERDTPEALKQYVGYFNPDFMGVTGPMEQLTPFTRTLGILHQKADDPRDPDNYLVDHSASILLFNPQGQLQAVLGAPHQVETLATDYLRILRHSGRS